MKTLIVYASKYGFTKECVDILSNNLNGSTDIYDLREEKNIDLSKYDKVIIGGSVYMGMIRKEVKKFCEENLNLLKLKKFGLFICCMREGKEAEEELKMSFPSDIYNEAAVKDYFGGAFIFRKMNFMDSFIVKKVAKTNKDTKNIFEDKIRGFAVKMNNL